MHYMSKPPWALFPAEPTLPLPKSKPRDNVFPFGLRIAETQYRRLPEQRYRSTLLEKAARVVIPSCPANISGRIVSIAGF